MEQDWLLLSMWLSWRAIVVFFGDIGDCCPMACRTSLWAMVRGRSSGEKADAADEPVRRSTEMIPVEKRIFDMEVFCYGDLIRVVFRRILRSVKTAE